MVDDLLRKMTGRGRYLSALRESRESGVEGGGGDEVRKRHMLVPRVRDDGFARPEPDRRDAVETAGRAAVRAEVPQDDLSLPPEQRPVRFPRRGDERRTLVQQP